MELHEVLDGGEPDNYPFRSHLSSELLYAERAECGRGREFSCPTIRALATIYSDHPDYNESWRP